MKMFLTRKIIISSFIFSTAVIISGCNSSESGGAEIDNTPNDLTSLQNARAKWDSYPEQYYTIQSQRFCECLPEMSAQMNVSVLDNTVLSAVDINSKEVISKEIQQEITTVDNLFVLIETAIKDEVSIDVTYNEAYGFPEIAKIDIEQLAADGGLHIALSNVEFQDSQLALDDITWTLESFDNIAGPQAVIQDTSVTLSVDFENSQLNGSGGCNSYNADFVFSEEDHTMTFSNVISTEMA